MKSFSRRIAAALVGATLLTACGPNDKQQKEFAEKQRLDCLDKICPGDVEPKRDMATEVALKLNGQWYVGPKYYFSTGMNGAAFYWPSKKNREDVPQNERAVPYANTVEIFLTGRQRWPEPNVAKPWELVDGMPPYWRELLSRGLTIKRSPLNPNLERVEFFKPDGVRDRTVYYVATNQKRVRGDGAPVLSCDISTPPHEQDRCFGGEYWQDDVFADFRFRATHATDWPAIHQEIARVLNLAKKVQP